MAAAAQAPRAAILSGATQKHQRAPPSHKDDKHMQHGRLLLAIQQSSDPVERLLAVARLSLTLLTDVLRRSDDTTDIPLLILGHHYMSHRVLGAGQAAPPSGPAASAPASTPAPGRAAASSEHRAWVQEICSFDAEEGPKSFAGVQGLPQAILELHLQPVAVAKAKRLGRELSIKVALQPSGSSSSCLKVLEYGEEYAISLPALLLLDPLSPACLLAFKGELNISCPQSGLLLSLKLAKDHTVKGSIEQVSSSSGSALAAAAVTAAGASSSRVQVIGSAEGSILSEIQVSLPQQGLEGVLFDSKAVSPPPVPSVDLRHLGPMRLSRLWSAIHDALLYADPRAAAGGRAAVRLATTLPRYLQALTLEGAASRDVVRSHPLSALGTPSSAAGSIAGLRQTGAAASTAGTDSDVEDFDRQAEGLTSGKLDAADDTRDVPPCYKEQHAAGNALRFQLHYTLTRITASGSTPGGSGSSSRSPPAGPRVA